MGEFHDDDRGYHRWLEANPNGFVLNLSRNPDPDHVRLHSATCRTISGDPANGVSWTRNYPKVCGSRDFLAGWAAALGTVVLECRCLEGSGASAA